MEPVVKIIRGVIILMCAALFLAGALWNLCNPPEESIQQMAAHETEQNTVKAVAKQEDAVESQDEKNVQELEHRMAGGKSHILDLGNIPRRDDDAARRGVALDSLDNLCNLIYALAIALWPAAPLVAIDMVQVAKAVALDRGLHAGGREEGIHIDGQYTMLHA